MRKLTILCDADDTIQELTVHWIAELNRKYNRNVKKEDVTSWDITRVYPGLNEDEIFAPLYKNEFWSKTTAVDGSGYFLEKLVRDGHKILIVTASNAETFEAKKKKLIEMFPFIKPEQIIRENNKQKVAGDVLIDDGVHNLVGGKYAKILFNQPHNAEFEERGYGITRVYSWREIYEKICHMAA